MAHCRKHKVIHKNGSR